MDAVMEAEVEDVVDLSVCIACKNYEEPGPHRSVANFLLGEEMEGDSPGREEVEGDALMAVSAESFYTSNDSNKCQFSSPIDVAPPAVNHHQVDVDFAVECDDSDIESTAAVHDVQLDEKVAPVNNHQVDDEFDVDDDIAAIDESQVDKDLLADDDVHLAQPSKPIRTHPKTSNKFGWGKRRGGDRKTTGTIDPILASQAANEGGVACHRPPTIAKKSTKKQLIRCLNKSEKKQQMTEDKMVVVTKKLHTATNDCKTLAVLAQERRRESNLALQHADCLMTGMRDEMTT